MKTIEVPKSACSVRTSRNGKSWPELKSPNTHVSHDNLVICCYLSNQCLKVKTHRMESCHCQVSHRPQLPFSATNIAKLSAAAPSARALRAARRAGGVRREEAVLKYGAEPGTCPGIWQLRRVRRTWNSLELPIGSEPARTCPGIWFRTCPGIGNLCSGSCFRTCPGNVVPNLEM